MAASEPPQPTRNTLARPCRTASPATCRARSCCPSASCRVDLKSAAIGLTAVWSVVGVAMGRSLWVVGDGAVAGSSRRCRQGGRRPAASGEQPRTENVLSDGEKVLSPLSPCQGAGLSFLHHEQCQSALAQRADDPR